MKVIAGSLLLVLVVGRHVIRDHDIAVHVCFRGGQTQSFHVAVGLTAPEAGRTPAAVIAEVDAS